MPRRGRPKGSNNKNGKAMVFTKKESLIFRQMEQDFLIDKLALAVPEMIGRYWDITVRNDGQAAYDTFDKKTRKLIGFFGHKVERLNPSDYGFRGKKLYFRACEYSNKYKHCRRYRVISDADHYTIVSLQNYKQIIGRAKSGGEIAKQGARLHPGKLKASITSQKISYLKGKNNES